MPRSLDVAIFMVTMTTDRQTDRQTKLIALPLAHVRWVMTRAFFFTSHAGRLRECTASKGTPRETMLLLVSVQSMI